MSDYAYQHIRKPINTSTGVADRLLFAAIYDFAVNGIKCPTPPALNPQPGDEVTITEDHTFIATKGFIEVVASPGANKLSAKTIGDPGSQKFDVSAEYFIAGNNPVLHEMAKNLQNQPCIVLVQDASCSAGVYNQVGCDCKFAWPSFEYDSGDDKGGKKGYKVTFNNTAESILTYTGEVTLKP